MSTGHRTAGVVGLGKVAVGAGALALGAAGAAGGPVRPELVPESARWVLHVDLEAAASGEVGRFLLGVIDEDSDHYKEIRQGLPGFTLSPEGGIDGITLFGRSFDDDGPEQFVAYIEGDERIGGWGESIDAALRQAGESAAAIEIGGRRAWGIPIDDGDETIFATLVERGERRTWVVSNDLIKAGEAAAFVGEGGREHPALAGLGWRAGTVAMVAAKDPGDIADFEEMSAVIGRARTLVARAGEHEGTFFAEAEAATDDPEGADEIARVLDGFLALGSMMKSEDPELARLMRFSRSLRIAGDDGRVRVTFEHDAGEVRGLIDEIRVEDKHADVHIELGGEDDD